MQKRILPVALLVLIGVFVYGNSLKGSLFWDDKATVINNVFVAHPVKHLSNIFTTSYHSGAGQTLNFYRPLATLSLALDYRIWRLNPLGYHLANLILHLLSGIFIFFILNRIFLNYKLSFISALLFLIHPINSEAVNYVSNRADLLMLFFFLAAFYSYLLWRRQGKTFFLAATYFLYSCSILSKEMGLVFPVFIVINEAVFFRQKRRYLPWIGFAAIFLTYVALRATWLNFLQLNLFTQGAQAVPYSRDLFLRLLVFAKISLSYLGLFFAPVNLHMEYDLPQVRSIFDLSAWLAATFLLSLAAVVFYLGRKEKGVIFAGLWFVAGLLPVSGIIPINTAMSEHYLYLSSIGFFVLFSWGALNLWEKAGHFLRPALLGLGLFILIVLSALTFLRNQAWQDPLKIYFEAVENSKTSYRANNNIGIESFRRGNFALAEKYFLRALEILPTYAPALNNLGVIYEGKDNFSQAEAFYLRALVSDPHYLLAQQNLASIYLDTGRIGAARELLKAILKSWPYDLKATSLLQRADSSDNIRN